MSHLACMLALSALFLVVAGHACAGEDPGTRVAKWKDDKKAAFMLMFDDNCPTHLKNAIPELKKRGLIATFYVVPGQTGLWTPAREKALVESGMVLANHTFNHTGAPDLAGIEEEIRKCSEVLDQITPNGDKPHLVSFGIPGGLKPGHWNIGKPQLKEILDRYHLVERPPFKGPACGIKTVGEITRQIDEAIAQGRFEYTVFHGFGGDWLSFSLPDCIAILDYVAERKDRLWVTDPISLHKYETEWKTAQVNVVGKDDQRIRLTLSCQADPKLYDQPLTLTTQVPAAWKKCRVTQGERKAVVEVVGGAARYDAVPCSTPIVLEAAD